MRVRVTLASPAATVAVAHEQAVSGQHSPVPYLFGGLAAMLALIAAALLILACSYWKLSGRLDSGAGEGDAGEVAEAAGSGWESKVLVIMAGQVVPTFLATRSTSRASSFGDASTAADSHGSAGGESVDGDGESHDKVVVAEVSGGGQPGSDAARLHAR